MNNLNISDLLLSLSEKGWFYQKDVFNNSFINDIKQEFNNKELKAATVGKNKNLHPEIRSDKIFWIEPQDNALCLATYFSFIDNLKKTLNEQLYLGLTGFEGHFAQYDKGTFYKPHKDNFKNSNARVVTTIIYLNNNWHYEDGGQLRLHLDLPIDIEPSAGSMIVFMSEEISHEVLLSYKERQALTGWLLRKSDYL